jgi:hypothetical protein
MKSRILILPVMLALLFSACIPADATTPSGPTKNPGLPPAAPTVRPTRARPTLTPVPQVVQPTLRPTQVVQPQGDGRAMTFVQPADANADAGMCDETQGFCNGAVAGLVVPVGYRVYGLSPVMPLLEIAPDGTLVRASDASFFLTELSGGAGNPYTRLTLQAGQLWIMLEKGTLEVESEIGVARVTDGCMGVNFDTLRITMTVTCLRGDCVLETHSGSVTLTDGQAADIPAPGQPASGPRAMNKDETQGWDLYNPEADE